MLAGLLVLCVSPAAEAQRRALSQSNARRAIAATPGFELARDAVRVREISAAGVTPVSVTAEVVVAFGFRSVEDERGSRAGMLEGKGWEAVEFRVGDRRWEELEFFAAPLGAGNLQSARASLEELVREFEARRAAVQGKSVEPLTRGALAVRDFSALGSSAVAEVAIEATFRLTRGAGGRWRVFEISVGGAEAVSPDALWQAVNARKAERARAELETIRAALESFRRERGFYVMAEDSARLMDHLSPEHIARVIRIDPWHNPYRYTGGREHYTISSDGADGRAGTADDVRLSGQSR